MKRSVEKRNPIGIVDHLALALTTFGVGYIPGAPGTYGSVLGVGIFVLFDFSAMPRYLVFLAFLFFILTLTLIGVWASGRSIELFGNSDPSQAVVDEVIGQLITFCFVPFGLGWPFILAGFLLFRLFDIWKPYPINKLQNLSGGLGVCSDDIVAGVYAGICLAIGYAIYLGI